MSDPATVWDCRHCGRHYDKAVEPEREESTVGGMLDGFTPHIECPGCGICMGCFKDFGVDPPPVNRTILQDVKWKKASDDSIRPTTPLPKLHEARPWSKRVEPILTRTITWVPVGERLPDDGQEVLVCCDVGVVYAQYCGRTYIFENPRDIPEGVTHWAELPEGPQ